MYNSMASSMRGGSKGSTRLHMDMADALNVMTYSSLTPDGRPGSAAWDLFKAEDSDKLRQFLRKKFKGTFQHDPIHSQQFYLDTDLRRELWEEYEVKSYRVYQKPGEAVFIPAGCAHQVSPHYLSRSISPLTKDLGGKFGGLRQSRDRLCQSREHPAMREPHEGVPRAKPIHGLERGCLTTSDDDVVCMAELQHA